MRMRKLYLLLLVGVLFGTLGACKKTDKIEIPKEFPVDLLAERWEVRTDTRLYTNNKEVSEVPTIRAFEERMGLKQLIENQDFSNTTLQTQFGVKFASENTATFFPQLNDGLSYDIERKGNRFLFYSRESYGVNPASVPNEQGLGYLHNMLRYADKLSSPGGSGLRQTREVRVAHGNYKVIKVSALVFVLKRVSPTETEEPDEEYLKSGVLYNEFDPQVRQFLGSSDTLAVKEYSIICTLRK